MSTKAQAIDQAVDQAMIVGGAPRPYPGPIEPGMVFAWSMKLNPAPVVFFVVLCVKSYAMPFNRETLTVTAVPRWEYDRCMVRGLDPEGSTMCETSDVDYFREHAHLTLYPKVFSSAGKLCISAVASPLPPDPQPSSEELKQFDRQANELYPTDGEASDALEAFWVLMAANSQTGISIMASILYDDRILIYDRLDKANVIDGHKESIGIPMVTQEDSDKAFEAYCKWISNGGSPKGAVDQVTRLLHAQYVINKHKSQPIGITIDAADPEVVRIMSLTHQMLRPLMDLAYLSRCVTRTEDDEHAPLLRSTEPLSARRAKVILELLQRYSTYGKEGYRKAVNEWIDNMLKDTSDSETRPLWGDARMHEIMVF